MLQLILVLISISLLAAIAVASINYLPSWTTSANLTYNQTKDGFIILESAFKAYSKLQGSPAPTVDPDGGLEAYFKQYYSFLPPTPVGYNWKYGHNGINYYFCLYSLTPTHEGLYRGFNRLKSVFSTQQYFVVDGTAGALSCDLTSNIATPTSYPVFVSTVYLVKYVPGMP